MVLFQRVFWYKSHPNYISVDNQAALLATNVSSG